jgi:hypothetical protein
MAGIAFGGVGGVIAVLQLLYTETTPQSGFFLKNKPPSIKSVRTYVLENRSSRAVRVLAEFCS